MTKVKGSDDVGDYVLWTNEDGQSNKKYISGDYAGEHQGYDPDNKRTFARASDRSWEEYSSDSGATCEDSTPYSEPGLCYIATATTKGLADAGPVIVALKHWRYTILEASLLGTVLSNHYRRTAPRVARWIESHNTTSTLIRRCFVAPAYKLGTVFAWVGEKQILDGDDRK